MEGKYTPMEYSSVRNAKKEMDLVNMLGPGPDTKEQTNVDPAKIMVAQYSVSCGLLPVLSKWEKDEDPSMMHTIKLEKISPKGGDVTAPDEYNEKNTQLIYVKL